MAYEKKEGDVVLFQNKKTNDKQPDFKGTVFLGGKDLDIAIWKRTSQGGKTYLSGSVKPQQPKQDKGVYVKDDNVSDIPF